MWSHRGHMPPPWSRHRSTAGMDAVQEKGRESKRSKPVSTQSGTRKACVGTSIGGQKLLGGAW